MVQAGYVHTHFFTMQTCNAMLAAANQTNIPEKVVGA